MTTPVEQGLAGTILHVDDDYYQREGMQDAFAKAFGYQTTRGESLPDSMQAGDVSFHTFKASTEIADYVSDDQRLMAMLAVGMIVAIVDGELEARGWGDMVQGSEVAAGLRRRVGEVIAAHPDQFAGRTVEDSLHVIAYSGRRQTFGNVNLDKLATGPDQVMTTYVQPQLARRVS